MSQLIYVETSIPSFYFETRLEVSENQARKNWTQRWWAEAMARDNLVTSLAVIEELARTPEPKQSKCLDLVSSLPLLDITEEVESLVQSYIENKIMPADTRGDALHLALATFHECDILASWNCRHIANASKASHIRLINGRLGFETPTLITPIELLEELP